MVDISISISNSIVPIVYVYEELGTLTLEHENRTDTNTQCLRISFNDVLTKIMYSVEYDEEAIRNFSPILDFNPQILDDFLVKQPYIEIHGCKVLAEFVLQFKTQVYGFTVQIPCLENTMSSEVLEQEILEQEQTTDLYENSEMYAIHENQIRDQMMDQTMERIMEQEQKLQTLANIYIQRSFHNYGQNDDESMLQCIDIADIDELSDQFDKLIQCIKSSDNKIGDRLLKLLKKGKFPKLNQYMIQRFKEILIDVIRVRYGCVGYITYLDRIMNLCDLWTEKEKEKETNTDTCIVYSGKCYFPDQQQDKDVKYSILELFDHQTSIIIPYIQVREIQELVESLEFKQKCTQIRELLAKLSKT